ncbi:MAG TPA: tetratricopeptide repeat protein [Chromatiales bacterium]|nr:tetratricopeptide repeat protein [Chromatiales bacterium]
MDDPVYRTLRNIAIVLTLAWVGWSAWDSFFREKPPGSIEFQAGERFFEDGQYAEAVREFDRVLAIDPDNPHAISAKARSLMQLGRNAEALELYDEAIARAPEVAANYANRGILHDRMGQYERAIRDYEKAIALDPEITEGPNWLTRFLRMETERPPTIADRAGYLREQLAKPESERVLRIPEEDEKQRSYKM